MPPHKSSQADFRWRRCDVVKHRCDVSVASCVAQSVSPCIATQKDMIRCLTLVSENDMRTVRNHTVQIQHNLILLSCALQGVLRNPPCAARVPASAQEERGSCTSTFVPGEYSVVQHSQCRHAQASCAGPWSVKRHRKELCLDGAKEELLDLAACPRAILRRTCPGARPRGPGRLGRLAAKRAPRQALAHAL
jgi:hypothetical protein